MEHNSIITTSKSSMIKCIQSNNKIILTVAMLSIVGMCSSQNNDTRTINSKRMLAKMDEQNVVGDWRPPKIKFNAYNYDNMNMAAIIIGSLWGALIMFGIILAINHNTDCFNYFSSQEEDRSNTIISKPMTSAERDHSQIIIETKKVDNKDYKSIEPYSDLEMTPTQKQKSTANSSQNNMGASRLDTDSEVVEVQTKGFKYFNNDKRGSQANTIVPRNNTS